jgi:hypothetical protein
MSFQSKWPRLPGFIIGYPDRFRGLIEIIFAVALAGLALSDAFGQFETLTNFLSQISFAQNPEKTILDLIYFLVFWWVRIAAAFLVVVAFIRGIYYLFRFGPGAEDRPLSRSGQIDTLLTDRIITPPGGPTSWGLRLAGWLKPSLRHAGFEVGDYVGHVFRSIVVWTFWLLLLASPYFFLPGLLKLMGPQAPRIYYLVPASLYWLVVAALALRVVAAFLMIAPSLRAEVAQRHVLQTDVGVPSAFAERLFGRLAGLVKRGRIYEHSALLVSTAPGDHARKFSGQLVLESPPRPATAPRFPGAAVLLVGGVIFRLWGFGLLLTLPLLVKRLGALVIGGPAAVTASPAAATAVGLGQMVGFTLLTGVVAIRLGSSLMNWGGRLIGAVGYESELMALRVNGRLDLTRLDPGLDPESALHPNRGVLAADSEVELSGAVIQSGVSYPGGPRFIWSARIPRNYEAALEERLNYLVAPRSERQEDGPAKASPAPKTSPGRRTAATKARSDGQPAPAANKGRTPAAT